MDRLDHYTDYALTDHEFQQLCWRRAAIEQEFQTYTVWCVNDQLYLNNYHYLPVKFGMQYTVGGMENGQQVLIDTNDIPWLPVDARRIRTRDELRSFVADEIRDMRDHHAKLNSLLAEAGIPPMTLDGGHYAEGFVWDVDDYPKQQTRRWNPETRQLEDGKDPPFEVPTPKLFEITTDEGWNTLMDLIDEPSLEAYDYLRRLFRTCAPQCEPLPNLLGLCTQIDNLIAGYRIKLGELPDPGVVI